MIGSRTNVYPNDNPFPATLWYHDHGEDGTAENVYRGLAGFFLLTPNQSEADADIRAVEAQLPSGYGRYDIPMVFQDRQFNADGSFAYNNFEHDGFIGDRFLVNGVIQPYLPVARRKYRFRWLNGSNARQYQFFLSSGDKFFVIGSDGGLLPQAAEVSSLRVAPAGTLRGRDRLLAATRSAPVSTCSTACSRRRAAARKKSRWTRARRWSSSASRATRPTRARSPTIWRPASPPTSATT